MLTTRDVAMLLAGGAIAIGSFTVAGAQPASLSSQVYDWTTLKAQDTKTGARREVVRAPTATLDELEMHITTLNPGETSHAPHQHPAEEVIIVKEGTVESLVNGMQKRIGAGSIVFQASNQMHAIRNVGTVPATYHVIQWQSPGMLKR
jgi:quercetin dioxygenase-like cupin family protein